jgi:hypothetical protein
MNKSYKPEKKNNAHLVNKDKLYQQAKDLEQELVFKQKPFGKRGQKRSNTKH